MEPWTIVTILVLCVSFLFLLKKFRTKSKQNKIITNNLKKYDAIISIEKEVELKKEEFAKLKTDSNILNEKYLSAKSIFEEIKKEVDLYRDDLRFVELGIYKPIFDLNTSEDYKEKLSEVVNNQKHLIKLGNACVCETQWYVGSSKQKGDIMTKQYINLCLKAFNGECDSLISKVKWNNISSLKERIKKSYRVINKLCKSKDTRITKDYLNLRLDELHLVHELANKKQQEKERAKEVRAKQREEEKAMREFDIAKKDAEKEEKQFQKALDLAKKDLNLVNGKDLDKLNDKIEQLEEKLKIATEKKDRAISRAQETKSGHVYIISNIGSFGKNIYKIGMTRRLDPMDRIKELGDASVPFTFDLHAMIYTENAPELEKSLHKEFESNRINKANFRKEYFNVSLDEIEKSVTTNYDKEVNFIKNFEAKEYHETLMMIKQNQDIISKQTEEDNKYPDDLF